MTKSVVWEAGYTHCVDDGLRAHFDVDHGSSQDVTCVIRLDLQLVIHLRATAARLSSVGDEQLRR